MIFMSGDKGSAFFSTNLGMDMAMVVTTLPNHSDQYPAPTTQQLLRL